MTPNAWDRHFSEDLDALKRVGGYRSLRLVQDVEGPWVRVQGRKVLQFASNDYLGLSQHPRLLEAAREALSAYGTGVGASRLVTGNYAPLDELERDVARFKGCEDALVFSSGYAANVGVISALANTKDRIISDRLNHASIVDGCRLSRARVEVYPHGDINALERLLARPQGACKTLVVTDGVFSMDGDVAPLREIRELCSLYGALLMVDDAHATGVLGENGRGSMEFWDIHDPSVVQMGTFSKALGGLGGFIAASPTLVDYLKNHARSLIFSTGMPPAVAASNREALRVVEEEPERRSRLLGLTRRLSQGLAALGFPAGRGTTPIIPLILGDADRAMAFSQALFEASILAPAIRPPSVPRGTSRVRLTLSALHEQEHVDRLLEAVEWAAKRERI